MTGEELKQARIALGGITQEEMATLLESRPRTIQDWESGRRSIPGPAAVAVKLLLDRDAWVTRYSVEKATADYRR